MNNAKINKSSNNLSSKTLFLECCLYIQLIQVENMVCKVILSNNFSNLTIETNALEQFSFMLENILLNLNIFTCKIKFQNIKPFVN